MDKVQQFREYTRELECHLDNINKADCCQCSISKAECFLVVEIGRRPGICIKELAGLLKIDKSGVSRNVEELVKKGFVTREPSKTDRRCVVLKLTERGNARFEKIEKDMYTEYKKVFSMIKKTDQNKVLEALRIYNEACRKAEGRVNG
ncbi:MAG: MarR family transcriptional regulator, partial [Lachnospiraceae bacterium]|nr:MarR family transcriptional regulator [Lachnospiraceae bacterium]